MKVHYTKILLLAPALNILLTSLSNVYNNNEPQTTPHHTRTTTSRVLSESDTESSIYDNDEDMESVKENFERQTSQRFEEYEERMKEKRQKRKEQRDKNIQKIIHKDKMEKNLAEKIEKGCLMCGCGLGSVAGSVGLFGGLGTYGWKMGALATAKETGAVAGALAGKAAGTKAGVDTLIAGLKQMGIFTLDNQPLKSFFTTTSYNKASVITHAVLEQHVEKCIPTYLGKKLFNVVDANLHIPICKSVLKQTEAASQAGQSISSINVIKTTVQTMVSNADGVAKSKAVVAEAAKKAAIEAAQEKAIEAASIELYTTIGYSILAILIIVLIMLIIYLILRYRRKKKMKKKAQYTKLLNE
ncbi:rifin PIR protein, putative [Plasmodium reichenowi]|uniref:Rifin PIR protein, putative n=1 Tax=Plasmodium reichenowi TaxID=5854 RepID=A0A2P9D4Q3_PLARE|nr:rifin PIR protein, putative [Plasmodium reichenowi]